MQRLEQRLDTIGTEIRALETAPAVGPAPAPVAEEPVKEQVVHRGTGAAAGDGPTHPVYDDASCTTMHQAQSAGLVYGSLALPGGCQLRLVMHVTCDLLIVLAVGTGVRDR